MVIAEARSYGVAVLMSDRVGAADLAFNEIVLFLLMHR
jgi:hypothetical protein